MTTHFLVDANLPVALARWIDERPHCSARHVDHLGYLQLADEDIWRLAAARNWVIITKDADFQRLRIRGPRTPRLIWLRTANATRQQTVACFARHWTFLESALADGAMMFEVREGEATIIR